MSTDADWNDVQAELSQLLGDGEFSTFHPVLRKLQQWSSAKKWEPEIYKGFIEIFQKIRLDIQSGNSIPDILKQIIEGSYVQQGWKVHSVYQANGHIFQFVFNDLRGQFSSNSKAIEVPVVLLVMNDSEAEELITLSAFEGYPAKSKKNFERFLTKQLSKEIPGWQKHYRASSELWQPFSNVEGGTNIRQLVITALDRAKTIYTKDNQPGISFIPIFKDIHTISNDRPSLKRLRHEGCVVVMDSISICHPAILRAFQRSLLDAYANTFVVMLSPASLELDEVHKMTTAFQFCLADLEFSKRLYDHDEKYGACKTISIRQEFEQWLIDRLWKTAMFRSKSDDQNTSSHSRRNDTILDHMYNL